LSLTVSARADEPINETTARQMTKLAIGFLSFTHTSYNENLATRQGLGCEVIARVDGKRSLAQNGGVDTEAPRKKGEQGDKGTRGQGEEWKRGTGNFLPFSLSPCLPLSLFSPPPPSRHEN